MINKLQELKGRTKLKFFQLISKRYDGMKYRRPNGYFQFKKNLFSSKAEGIA